MRATTFIYSLNCPITGNPRYVGKADNPEERYAWHLRHTSEGTHKSNWIRSLLPDGLLPELEILCEVPVSCWQGHEARFISQFRAIGFDLTNSTDGGDGVTMTLETREKIGTKLRGNKNSLGRKHSLEARSKMSCACKGRGHPQSPETRAKIGEAQIGRKRSPATRAKIGAALSGKPGREQDPQTREKISAGVKAYWEEKRKYG
jgi:hypothetical protein